jgi:predicted nucleic acid-binding protein
MHAIEKNHPVMAPTIKNWVESGKILSKMRASKGFEADKLRALHFDVLIALTTRTLGARLITSNRGDFELIAAYTPLRLEIWP